MRANVLSWGAGLALALSCAATPARAGGLALDRFDPAPAGDRMFGAPSPFVAGHLTPHVMLLSDYARNPLMLRTHQRVLGSIVANQLLVHVNANLALWNRLAFNVDLPVALLQSGDSPSGGGQTFTSPSSVALSDLRLGLRVRLVGNYHDLFQLALAGSVWVPTATGGSFVGDGKVRGMPHIIAGGRRDRFLWALAFGAEIRPSQTYAWVTQGTMLRWNGGAGVLLGARRHLQIGAEVAAAITPSEIASSTTNAEVLVGVRYRVHKDVEVGLGMGPGLTVGSGTPLLRGVVSVAYTPEQPSPDQIQGPDRDGDRVPDAQDVCLDMPSGPDADPKRLGCPKDDDIDGIPNAADACPKEKGHASANLKENGCPRHVRVTAEEILLLTQVEFDTAKTTIRPVSAQLLDEMSQVLREHPEFMLLEVQGHTDSQGTVASNDVLSQGRADMVRQEIIRRGIEPHRLRAKGYGQSMPVADNATEEGRQKNRRVQLKILKK